MIYLATPSTTDIRNAVSDGRLGALLTPESWSGTNTKVHESFVWWAADGACVELVKGQPVDREAFSWEKYREWLEVMSPSLPSCLFAVAPDRIGNHEATLARFKLHHEEIRALGYPVAFVAQDGADAHTIPWTDIDALFVGGSTDFKLSETAYYLAGLARRRGKWAHMGRVNSFQRLRRAAAANYDSADGTYLTFGPDKNLPKLLRWLDYLDRHAPLPWEVPA